MGCESTLQVGNVMTYEAAWGFYLTMTRPNLSMPQSVQVATRTRKHKSESSTLKRKEKCKEFAEGMIFHIEKSEQMPWP